jgi:hypothetical protein
MKWLLAPLLLTSSLALSAEPSRGEAIYKQVCFTCHGPTLQGGIGPSLVDSYWHHGSSPEAILDVINHGIEGSEMIGYKDVFPEADLLSLRDFLISKQEGPRELVRSLYPREAFSGKRLTLDLFRTVESTSQTLLPENWISMERNADAVLRATTKLYIVEPGTYSFAISRRGRTAILLDGKEVHYSDDKAPKTQDTNQSFTLKPGTYALEILHEEKRSHRYRFHGTLNGPSGKKFPLNGRSLQGNIPKIIKARPGEALVVRKWIKDLPPRALLCLLSNKVIVAYNAADGSVLKAWHSAEINQTPSLPDRSQKPSEIKGTPIAETRPDLLGEKELRFLYYKTEGDSALVSFQTKDGKKTVSISPKGAQSFSLSVQ